MTSATRRNADTDRALAILDAAQAASDVLATATPAEKLDGPGILAELPVIDGPLTVLEKLVDDLRLRRLNLWCAARLLDKEGGRPIFMDLANASNRSEALVIKATKKAFKDRGITPPR